MNGDVLLSFVVLIIRTHNADNVGQEEKLQLINSWFSFSLQVSKYRYNSSVVVYQHHQSGQNSVENVWK